ncbi:polysaccharide deacetylase family protein [Neoroseomonas soli]|uniref:Chitooligosaccharide deacetylase n=1 Tax=Neoroseomonas soli TaxID=1081025 RepID=A0A9X9WYR1_9PROT|nr:polysaccharide deacetylase family protein [Neoroseomonas soli]MBR0672290.1 polysaccharide deacetylase family protein [Neoroseomonas soli]
MCRCCPSIPPLPGRRDVHRLLLAAALAPAGLAAPEARADDHVAPRLHLAAAPAGRARVALTLDACAGAADMRVLGGLMRLGVRATVFVTARWLRANPGTVALLRERQDLFALQNHGERHVAAVLGAGRLFGQPVAGTLEGVRREVEGGAAAIVAAGAPAPGWYRGATALYSPAALAEIRGMGLRVAGFSVNADQGASLPAAQVARRIAAARDGDVIIAHTNRPDRPSGPGVVEGAAMLQARGTAFAWLDGEAMVEA